MTETSVQISERLKLISRGETEIFRYRNRLHLTALAVLILVLSYGVDMLWQDLRAFDRFLTPRTWYEPLLMIVSLGIAIYVFRTLIFRALGKAFGAPCFALAETLTAYSQLLGLKTAETRWRFADIGEAEVCHRDDGKTYGVGPVPAPGQFFVRLRLKNTTHMLTDWIEEIEAKAIAGAINKRLEKARRQAA